MTYKVRAATHNDLSTVAQLHRRAFPGFFMTLLGTTFLKGYYAMILRCPSGVLLLAEDETKIIRGFAAGFRNPAQFYAMLQRDKHMLVVRAAWGVLCRPWLVGRLWRMRRQDPRLTGKVGDESAFELSSIAVDPSHEGKGIGTLLVRETISRAREMGATEVYVYTDAYNNDRANAFYSKLGFVRAEVITSTNHRKLNHLILRIK